MPTKALRKASVSLLNSLMKWLIELIAPFALLTSGALAFRATPNNRIFSHSTKLFYGNTAVNNNVVVIDENAPRDVATMEEWATSCGVQKSDGFQLVSNDEYGRDISVVTNQDIPANSPVLYVPEGMILSSQKAVAELGPGSAEAYQKIESSLNAKNEWRQFYLMLKILVEYERGAESPWFPWLNSLPRYFSNGASMTSFCYECVPPLVRKMAMQERVNWRNLYAAVKLVPFLSEELRSSANKHVIKWAFQIAYTRSFEVPNYNNDNEESSQIDLPDLRIVPMVDSFNHGASPEVVVGYDEEGNCYAQTTQDVPAGSPLRVSYGDPTNPSFLLARYGFLDESSPATFCKFMIPKSEHTNQLKDMGYAPNRMLFYKDTGEASEEVFDVITYQWLGSVDMTTRGTFYQAHMNGDYETKQAMLQEFWPQTSAILLEHIDGFLQQLQELSAKGVGMDLNEHPRLPLILEHNEFVKNTFLAVRQRYFS